MGVFAATTVDSTSVPPQRTTTAPSACLATLSVSIENDASLIWVCTEWGIRSASSSTVWFGRADRQESGAGPGAPDHEERDPPGSRRHRRIPSFSVTAE